MSADYEAFLNWVKNGQIAPDENKEAAARRAQYEDGRPAFPQGPDSNDSTATGMTMREYYAGQAIQGVLPGTAYTDQEVSGLAKAALRMADAIIKESRKRL